MDSRFSGTSAEKVDHIIMMMMMMIVVGNFVLELFLEQTIFMAIFWDSARRIALWVLVCTVKC
jgi:hypothetical protein